METYAPIFSGFYETAYGFEPDMNTVIDMLFNDEDYTENQKRFIRHFVSSNYETAVKEDYQQYETDVAKSVCKFLEEELSEFFKMKIEVEFQNIHSPKYYNFSNDSINVNVKCENWDEFMGKMLSYVKEHIEHFKEYIKDNYTSYDGFMSFYSNDVKDWLKEEYSEHEFGSILEFVLRENDKNIEESMMYYVMENVSAEMYCDITENFKHFLETDAMKNIFKEYEKLLEMKETYIQMMKNAGRKPNFKALALQEEKNNDELSDEVIKGIENL